MLSESDASCVGQRKRLAAPDASLSLSMTGSDTYHVVINRFSICISTYETQVLFLLHRDIKKLLRMSESPSSPLPESTTSMV